MPADDLFRLFFEVWGDALLLVDPEQRVVAGNAASEGLLGYPSGALVGVPLERLGLGASEVTPTGAPRPGLVVHLGGHELAVDVSVKALEHGTAFRLVMLRERPSPTLLRLQASALTLAPYGVLIADLDARMTWVNPALTRLSGYEAHELVGQRTRIFKSGQHDVRFYQAMWSTLLRGETWSGVLTNRRKDGTLYLEEQVIAPVLDELGRLTHFIAIKHDIEERARAQVELARANEQLHARLQDIEGLNAALRELATRDPLTGLYNRRYFSEVIDRDVARARRDGGGVCLIVIDIDDFKAINDAYGHEAGDRVLVALATQLFEDVRASDLPARFGGEEFVVALVGISLAAAARRAERWRARFAATSHTASDGRTFHTTFSAGLAVMGPADSVDDTLRRADAAMYAAKQAGKNRVLADQLPESV